MTEETRITILTKGDPAVIAAFAFYDVAEALAKRLPVAAVIEGMMDVYLAGALREYGVEGTINSLEYVLERRVKLERHVAFAEAARAAKASAREG